MNGFHNLPIESLLLDAQNPRLADRFEQATQTTIINWMLIHASLTTLMASIVNNHFFWGEAIIGVKDEKRPGKIIIIEGNRRLAAVLLLNNPQYATYKTKTVNRLAEEGIKNRSIPGQLPVSVIENRNQLAGLLGFRHITGIQKWSLISQARYAGSLMIENKWLIDIDKQLTLRLGGSALYSKRLRIGHCLYSLIENHHSFGIDNLLDEHFDLWSLIEAIVTYPAIEEYLGIKTNTVNPIENINLKHFKNIIEWLYKRDENFQTRVDIFHLSALNSVLDSQDAKSKFIDNNYSLEEAMTLTPMLTEKFNSYLQNARFYLIEAQKIMHAVKTPGTIEVNLINEIFNFADLIKRSMAEKIYLSKTFLTRPPNNL